MNKIQTWAGALQAYHFHRVCGIAVVGLLLLTGCSAEQPDATQTEATIQASSPADKIADAGSPLADMVKAVPVSPGEKPVELRFVLPAQPLLGTPFDVNLNILGLADATAIELKITASSKLDVVAGATASLGALKTGASMDHTVQVRMGGTGIAVMDVQLTATVAGTPVIAVFTIPVALRPADAAAADTVK